MGEFGEGGEPKPVSLVRKIGRGVRKAYDGTVFGWATNRVPSKEDENWRKAEVECVGVVNLPTPYENRFDQPITRIAEYKVTTKDGQRHTVYSGYRDQDKYLYTGSLSRPNFDQFRADGWDVGEASRSAETRTRHIRGRAIEIEAAKVHAKRARKDLDKELLDLGLEAAMETPVEGDYYAWENQRHRQYLPYFQNEVYRTLYNSEATTNHTPLDFSEASDLPVATSTPIVEEPIA